jgi:cysteine desulfurase
VALRPIDLDRAATTPVADDVLAAMLPYFGERAGNPASTHAAGRLARRGLETAREQLAAAVGAAPSGVVFTSGATEAIHLAVHGLLAGRPGAHVVTSPLEHAATLAACRAAERAGARLTLVAPDAHGVISPEAVLAALRDDTLLVALMRVNNETGVVSEVAALGEAVRARGGRLLVDAVQAFGYDSVTLEALGADLVALSAHKVEGPKGVGALVLRGGVTIEPLVGGGSQERGLRAGTSPVPLAVGFGVAAERAASGWRERATNVAALRDRLERALRAALPGLIVHGEGAPRGPKHLNVRFTAGAVDGESLLINLDAEGVLASAGSACAAGSLEPSHVLLAMGLSRAEARGSVRFSLGGGLDEASIDDAASRIVRAAERTLAIG